MHYPRRWLSRRRDASLVLVLLHTGLRVSEAIAMLKRDVQLSERKGQVAVCGKGTRQRTVPLNAEARQALQAWLEVRPIGEDEHVFVSTETSDGLTARSAQRILNRYGRAAGIESLTPHVLRHSFRRSFGRLVNASMDATREQTRVFSPWRFSAPRHAGLVSFQGTGASCEGKTTPQKANVQKGWEGLAGNGRRRDMTKPRLTNVV